MMGLTEVEEDPEGWRNMEEGWSQVFRVRSKLKRNGELVQSHDAPGMSSGQWRMGEGGGDGMGTRP